MSEAPPFFSIVIPTYNAEGVIARMIESVLSQSFNKFELLIIDGASTDRTIEIIKSYRDVRISVYSEPDQGIYDAMNKGLAKSRGQWIYFGGSDDYLIDRDVLKDVAAFVQRGFDFVYGNVDSPVYGNKYDGEFNSEKILGKNICHQAIFVSRHTFQMLGFFNTSYKICADWDFNIRCFLSPVVRTGHIDRTIAFFSPGGASSLSKVDDFVKNRKHLIIQYGAGILPEKVLKRFYPSRMMYWRDRLRRFFNLG